MHDSFLLRCHIEHITSLLGSFGFHLYMLRVFTGAISFIMNSFKFYHTCIRCHTRVDFLLVEFIPDFFGSCDSFISVVSHVMIYWDFIMFSSMLRHIPHPFESFRDFRLVQIDSVELL